jgi:hypothetical protein
LNWDISDAMSTVKELMLSPEGSAAVAAGDDAAGDDAAGDDAAGDDAAGVEVVELDDEQPAAIRARTAAVATTPTRGRGLNVPWPCERECPPPCLLLPKSIPYPFRQGTHG